MCEEQEQGEKGGQAISFCSFAVLHPAVAATWADLGLIHASALHCGLPLSSWWTTRPC